jgi:hypothetical protein
MLQKPAPPWVKDAGLSITILCLVIIASLFFGHSKTQGGQAIIKAFLRFFRIGFVLCIPFGILFPVYRRIIGWKKDAFLRVQQHRELTIHPMKHWLFRPFQGIGIAFLFRSKLMVMLQLVAGPSVPASLVVHRGGGFGPNHFFLTSAITAFVGLLLSILWTLDDMGIRYFNERDHELKMIGKYVGTLMPVIFGLYGIFGLMANYPVAEALLNIVRAVIILYPPFVLFAVLHTYVIRRRKKFLDTTNMVKPGEICAGAAGPIVTADHLS